MKKFFILGSIVLLLLTAGTASTVMAQVPIPIPPGSASDFVDDIYRKSQEKEKKEPCTITCSRCNGSGGIVKTEGIYNKQTKKFESLNSSQICPVCSGSGRVSNPRANCL